MKTTTYTYTLEVKGETYTYTDKEEAMTNYEYEEMMGNEPKLYKTIRTEETLTLWKKGLWM